MWSDGEFLDARTEAREAAEENAQWEEHQFNHDSEEAPIEGCSFCDEEVADREMDARSEAEEEKGEAA
jgi:hypothetical protein